MRNNLMLNLTLKKGAEKAWRFRKQGTYMMNKVIASDPSLANMTSHEFKGWTEFTSICMSMGSELTKRKYTLLGVGIGVAGTLVVLKLKNRNKKKEAK
jgi:uracil DNA glycosylase